MMLKLEDILKGDYELRSVKDREGDKDYFIDNYGKPLILRYKIEMEFFQVSTILIRIGQGDIFSVHFLMDRDLLSAMSFIELDARDHYIDYSIDEQNSRLVIRQKEESPRAF
ncbi:MAG: hypothetical protein EOM07_08340 [Clostridia bacterium]|nr:hypothetical protein [Clostridia bacterium]